MAEDMNKKKKQAYICIFILSTFFVIKASNLIFQLGALDFENNPELKRLQFLAPGPKMAGLTKGTLPPKKDQLKVKQGRNN